MHQKEVGAHHDVKELTMKIYAKLAGIALVATSTAASAQDMNL
jgi:hypothetical protein